MGYIGYRIDGLQMRDMYVVHTVLPPGLGTRVRVIDEASTVAVLISEASVSLFVFRFSWHGDGISCCG